MKLKEIHRTATFAWSPSQSIPLLASGTVSGALDESFSNDSQLEIWAPDFLDKTEYDLGGEGQVGPKAAVTTNSRFNRVVWGHPSANRSLGVIAAGMENGELGLWNPEKILALSDPSESLILRNTIHQGSVRGLDFNPIQTNLLASGAVNGEIFVWDLKDPSKPYSPGGRSSKLDEITALAWNRQVQHVLASSSSTGYTVVWDLRGKREVVALAYGGGAATFPGPGQNGRAIGIGGRRGMSDVAWHPDNATRLVTSSEDDSSPIVMVWDLRNARAPEKILTGHEKGVLSLSWCSQDADLLLSCGKDNRALCWNPQTSEIIGELPSADNWAFQVQWCPRNPDLLATAYFDGTVGIHSLQSTNEAQDGTQSIAPTPRADGSDVFDVPGFSRTTQATLSLKQPPKWLRRPVSSTFGYGGKLISVSNLPSAQGRNQSSAVHIRKVVTEPSIVERSKKLQAAEEGQTLKSLAEEKSKSPSGDVSSWKALLSLFQADSRDELITLLGFSKSEIAARVADAVERIKSSGPSTQSSSSEADASEAKHGPVVSFAEPEYQDEIQIANESGGEQEVDLEGGAGEPTPSEQSAGAASDRTDITKAVDSESTSTTTAPSLFGDDAAIGTPHQGVAADFFSSMGILGNSLSDGVHVPHHNYALNSSVAATIGSRPSSSASEVAKNNTFRIYPSDESDIDHLVTKALVLGDFESAVSLCLSSKRYADAILLAVKGGPELLQRTQQAYFEKRTTVLPYLRLFQSIVTNDLADIVQNADLQEWREIFVVLCTFAKPDEFANLTEQLGQRLEFQGTMTRSVEASGAEEFRRNATLTYLAAGRLEKVVNIWIEEMAEEENLIIGDDRQSSSRYSAHAHALQTFMEKVAVFRTATHYTDADLKETTTSSETATVRSYKLSGLYDRYYEYADLLAAQGLLGDAVKYLKLTPLEYQGGSGSDNDYVISRERLLSAAGLPVTPKITSQTDIPAPSHSNAQPLAQAPYAYPQYSNTAQPQAAVGTTHAVPQASAYAPYNPVGSTGVTQAPGPYGPSSTIPPGQQPYQPTAPMHSYSNPHYAQATPYNQPAQTVQVPAPPPPINSGSQIGGAPNHPPSAPPKRRENGGWNDAPLVVERRAPSALSLNKPNAITTPFPNAMPSPGPIPTTPMLHGQAPPPLPPPPRPGSVQLRGSPQNVQGPPGMGQLRPPPGPQQSQQGPYPPPPGRAFSPPQGQSHAPPPPQARFGPPQSGSPQFAPPGRALSPGQGPARQPPPRQFSPPQRAPGGPQPGGPPGQYAHGGPSPAQGRPYARATPPPAQQQMRNTPPPQAGPYGPPQGMSRPAPPPGSSLGPGGLQPQNGPRGPPPPGAGPPSSSPAPAPAPAAPKGPPPAKYSSGDRSHIPDSAKRSYGILAQELNRLKQTSPPQQKRMVEDTERRVNSLFDALNCETLSPPVVGQLSELTEAMAARDQQRALAIHVDLLTRASRTDDVALWMSGVKQLILRL